MTTTLDEARYALLQLEKQFPAPSVFARHLAALSDYFDNQVPLNVENNALAQRVTVLEAFIAKVRESLPGEDVKPAAPDFSFARGERGARAKGSVLYEAECTAWLHNGLPCQCTACRARAHA